MWRKELLWESDSRIRDEAKKHCGWRETQGKVMPPMTMEEVERKRNLINQIFVYGLYLEIRLSDSDSWDINPIIHFLCRLLFSYKIIYTYKAILFGVLKEKYYIFTKWVIFTILI